MSGLLCIGHRGACGYEPENTLRSIRLALDLGAQGVEIDVQLVDGRLIVFHDSRLERTTNGRGLLRKQKFERLRELDAGKGEQIPTLEEVFDTVNRRAVINIELKGRGTARPVWELMSRYIEERGWAAEDFLISSFVRKELREFRAVADPQIPLGLLLARPTRFWLRTALHLHAAAVHPGLRFVSQRLVQDAHDHQIKVFVYTVNTETAIHRMRAMSVDGVFTDYPDRVLK